VALKNAHASFRCRAKELKAPVTSDERGAGSAHVAAAVPDTTRSPHPSTPVAAHLASEQGVVPFPRGDVSSTGLSRSASPAPTPLKPLQLVGLRNLGNTCFLNSSLQLLLHLAPFQKQFLSLYPQTTAPSSLSSLPCSPLAHALPRTPTLSTVPVRPRPIFMRMDTLDCYTRMETETVEERLARSRHRDHRNVGSAQAVTSAPGPGEEAEQSGETPAMVLCDEWYALVKITNAGKWACVTPHAMLRAMWRVHPSFYGYAQQDAQVHHLSALRRGGSLALGAGVCRQVFGCPS
jgi:hypothetical protein